MRQREAGREPVCGNGRLLAVQAEKNALSATKSGREFGVGIEDDELSAPAAE